MKSFSKLLFPALLAALFLIPLVSAEVNSPVLLQDDFAKKDQPPRRAMRGNWSIENGIAAVTQDDELYKKFKDHGPILFWDLGFKDAAIRFSFRAKGANTVVFTGNGADGHVFRFVMSERGLNVRAFPPQSDVKSVAVANEKDVPLSDGEWTDVVVTLVGKKATIRVGKDFQQTYENASWDREKVNLSVGFSFGSLEVKDVSVRGIPAVE